MHRIRLLKIWPKVSSLALYPREPFPALREALYDRHNPRFSLALQQLEKEAFRLVNDGTVYCVFEYLNERRDVGGVEVEGDYAVYVG